MANPRQSRQVSSAAGWLSSAAYRNHTTPFTAARVETSRSRAQGRAPRTSCEPMPVVIIFVQLSADTSLVYPKAIVVGSACELREVAVAQLCLVVSLRASTRWGDNIRPRMDRGRLEFPRLWASLHGDVFHVHLGRKLPCWVRCEYSRSRDSLEIAKSPFPRCNAFHARCQLRCNRFGCHRERGPDLTSG